jgi:hypothetical protein
MEIQSWSISMSELLPYANGITGIYRSIGQL